MAYYKKRSNGKWMYTVSLGIDPLTKNKNRKLSRDLLLKKRLWQLLE